MDAEQRFALGTWGAVPVRQLLAPAAVTELRGWRRALGYRDVLAGTQLWLAAGAVGVPRCVIMLLPVSHSDAALNAYIHICISLVVLHTQMRSGV